MIGCVRWSFPEVDSTQRVAFQLAQMGAPHGTIVRADFQSAGRGRQDRTWEAARHSALMFSVILRPNHPLHQMGAISILVAEALAETFAGITSAAIQIKWPNDVLIEGEKASGILMQTRSGPEALAVLGIGINIDSADGSIPESATCLNQHAGHLVDPDRLLESVLHRLNRVWEEFAPEIDAEHLGQLDSRLWLRGETVSLLDGNREIHGVILGLASNGGLRLLSKGTERVVVAGEIVRGPRLIPPVLKE